MRAEDGLELFKNCTRQSSERLTIHDGGSETCHTIGLAMYYTKTNKQNLPAPSHGPTVRSSVMDWIHITELRRPSNVRGRF